MLRVLSGPSPHRQAGYWSDYKTPLHKAAEHGHAKTVQILVDAGADVIVLTGP